MHCQLCQTTAEGTIIPLTVVHGVRIFSCVNCGLGFVNPQTPRKPTHDIYSFADYDIRRRRFEQRYKNVIKKIYSLFPDKAHKKKVKILEVGAGFGLLSKMLHYEGFAVTALEPYLKPYYLRGTAVTHRRALLSTFAVRTRQKYDCIILFDVLEHVDSLNKTLQEISSLLTEGGILIVQTPNYRSLMQYLSRNWSWWMVEDHRYFFTKKSLMRLFTHQGFTVVSYTSYEDWQDYLQNIEGGVAYITNPVKRKVAKLCIYAYGSLCKILLQPFYTLGYGGLHLIFVRKNKQGIDTKSYNHKSITITT